MKISVIIPTYNPAEYFPQLLEALQKQNLKIWEIIIVDSSYSQFSQDLLREYTLDYVQIPQGTFNHGGTRTMAGKKSQGDFLIYMTQDALPFDNHSLQRLIEPLLEDETIAATFGRQIAYPSATPFAAHLRHFNYPDHSYVRTFEDQQKFGLKAAFLSNTFAAYRRSALKEVGWFEEKILMAEDMCVSASLLMKGYKTAYVAEAKVYHSHNYTILEEFQRYFDIGVFHRQKSWILKTFGRPEKEGFRYILSEFFFLVSQKKFFLIFEFFIRNLFKYLGYKLGTIDKRLPKWLVKKFSRNKKILV